MNCAQENFIKMFAGIPFYKNPRVKLSTSSSLQALLDVENMLLLFYSGETYAVTLLEYDGDGCDKIHRFVLEAKSLGEKYWMEIKSHSLYSKNLLICKMWVADEHADRAKSMLSVPLKTFLMT